MKQAVERIGHAILCLALLYAANGGRQKLAEHIWPPAPIMEVTAEMVAREVQRVVAAEKRGARKAVDWPEIVRGRNPFE